MTKQTPGTDQPQTQRGDAVAIKKGGVASVMSGAMSGTMLLGRESILCRHPTHHQPPYTGALISMCVQPLDVVKTRMQADAARGTATSAVTTLRTIVAHDGVRALWQGTQPTVIR